MRETGMRVPGDKVQGGGQWVTDLGRQRASVGRKL